MIARLRGTLLEKRPGLLVLDVSGVGYEISVTLSTFRETGEAGAGVDLHVHTHVREGALTLYGFASRLEQVLFRRLIEVNGVGPKMAIAVLSGLGAHDLVAAIREGDARRLSDVPGIGRKTAGRILLEMADRLEDLAAAGAEIPADGGEVRPAMVRRDLISALVNLGYNARVAAAAAGDVLGSAPGAVPPFETLLRQSLKRLSR